MNTKQPIRGLTLLQPWDVAFIKWGKPLDNRSWKPASFPVGGYLALHRGKGYDLQGAQWLINNRDVLGLPGDVIIPGKQKESGIIGVGRYTGYVTESDSPWFFGPYGLGIADFVPFPLIPCSGALSLWELPPDVLRAVREAYAAALTPKPQIDQPPLFHCICPTPGDARGCIEARYGHNRYNEQCECMCHQAWDTWAEGEEMNA